VDADNQAETRGSGLYIQSCSPRLLHTTIARNTSGDGSGVHITGTVSTVAMTNTILVSHSVGVTVATGNTATLNGVLWYSSTINYGGDGTIAVTNEYIGHPAFAADGYHLTAASAAIDKGVNAGVDHDIDGDPRPIPASAGYDLGADEFPAALSVAKWAFPSRVLAGAPLTYTIHVTNTGIVTLTAIITDTLPEHVTPTGIKTWTPIIIAPDDVWTGVVVVTSTTGYSGTLTNAVHVATDKGVMGADTTSSQVWGHFIYLPLMFKNVP